MRRDVEGVAPAERDRWLQRLRARVSARIEARRRQHAYSLSRPRSIRRALWRLHDERELRRRRDAYLSSELDLRDPDVARVSLPPSPPVRSTARDAATVVIAATACTVYLLGILAFVLDAELTPSTSSDGRPRAAAPPSAVEPTTSGPSDEGGAASTAPGTYRSSAFRFWHPPGWTVSGSGRMSVLESPSSDVIVAFAPAPRGSLEDVAEGALADLEATYGNIRLLPAGLTFAGKRSLVVSGSAAEEEEGGSSRFLVIALTRPSGNATITVTFAPRAAPLTYVAPLQRILDSFTIDA